MSRGLQRPAAELRASWIAPRVPVDRRAVTPDLLRWRGPHRRRRDVEGDDLGLPNPRAHQPVRAPGAASERVGALEPIDFAGGTVAWVGRDGSAYVLDVDAGGEVRAVAPEADFVDVDPTGTRLAVMSKPGDVTVYALPGLEATWTAKGDEAITIGDQIDALGAPPAPPQFASLEIHGSLAWTPDSQALVASRTFILRTLDARKRVRSGPRRSMASAPSFSPSTPRNLASS